MADVLLLPTVSIVVPNYNHAAFLEQRLDTLLAQTYTDYELILLDDASTDESVDILERYRQEHDCIRADYNTTNTGNPFPQWHKGIGKARGKLIWIAESDDFCESTFLEKTVPLFDENPTLGIAYCGTSLVDKEGRACEEQQWMERYHKERWLSDFHNGGVAECRDYLIFGNTIPNASGVLFRKEIYENVGGIDLSFRFAADWDLWTRILIKSDVAYVAEKLNSQRYHSESVMATSKKSPLSFLEYHRVRMSLLPKLSYNRETVALCREEFARDFVSSLVDPEKGVQFSRFGKHYLASKRAIPELSFIDWYVTITHALGRLVRKYL